MRGITSILADVQEGRSSVLDMLFDLPPGQEALFFHVLVCSSCRERATVALLERHGTRLMLPEGELARLVDGDCDAELPLDGLLADLLRHPQEQHFELLEEPRFQDGLLVAPLLERSGREQTGNPELSEHLAFLAARLASLTLTADDKEKAAFRAGELTVNARRLLGRLRDAEVALEWVGPAAAGRSERARFLRCRALVDWELGRLDEAARRLEEAARWFSAIRLRGKEGETLTLLGLLYSEMDLLPQSAGALLAGLPLLGTRQRPWLAARGCLTLARALAESSCAGDARLLLGRGRQLIPAVEDPHEASLLYGLQGAVLGALGEGEEACGLLRPVRNRHLMEAQAPEAALATLDLALVLAERGREEEIEVLAAELKEQFPGVRTVAEAVSTLRGMRWSDVERRRADSEAAGAVLRRLFRSHGPRPRPLPFA